MARTAGVVAALAALGLALGACAMPDPASEASPSLVEAHDRGVAAPVAATPGSTAATGVADCAWLAPVDAPVVDPFRAPEHRFGPGNRGLEYGVSGGETAVAVAAGRVTFRGPVAGRLYLVIDHGDGLRSTYGPMRSLDVVRGADVTGGQPIGAVELGFHLTARLGDDYVDPTPRLDGDCGRPRLVPT